MKENSNHSLTLADGSCDYGDGIIGPSLQDIFLSNKMVNAKDRKKILQNEKDFLKKIPLIDRIPNSWRSKIGYAAGPITAVCAIAASCDEENSVNASEVQPKLEYSLTLPFVAGETWWFSNGPHGPGDSAIDILASENKVPCDGRGDGIYRGKFVRAIADGEVVMVGNENDKNDANHSVVKIKHDQDFVSGYMHLAEMQVEVGDKVEQGDALGYVSCEIPQGGSTSGAHLHFWGEIKGKPITIDRVFMSGWEVGQENGEGVMRKDGLERIADQRRCSNDTVCGGIRNDIFWGELKFEKAPTIAFEPTAAPVPTIAPVPTVAKRETQPVSPPPGREPLSPPDDDIVSPDGSGRSGVVNVLGWEMRMKSWGDEPDYEYGFPPKPHEGWRRVVISGEMVNSSGGTLSTASIVQYFNTYEAYGFMIEGQGNQYEAEFGQRQEGGIHWEATDWMPKVEVPNGLYVPFVIVAEVPNTVQDFELALYDRRTNELLDDKINKGEVFQDLPEDDKPVDKPLSACVVANYAQINYAGEVQLDAVTIANGNFKEQFLTFDVQNLSGFDIPVNYGWGGIEVAVFEGDGTLREGGEYHYSRQFEQINKIAPGLTKRVFVNVGTDGGDEVVDNNLTDLRGAVVNLTIYDSNKTKRNCDWQLP